MTKHARNVAAALAFAAAFSPAAPLLAQSAQAGFTIVESGRSFASLQDAVNAIGDGQGTIAIAPGRYAQCAVQTGGTISYLASEPGSAVFDGVACEGKATLVLRGRGAEVAGLVFQNIAVPDYNGAGIRLEKGDLTVAQSWFKDSQQGILTGNDTNSTLVIDKSTFTRLGNCDSPGGCAHSIYVGEYGHLRVTRSRFEKGTGGHYLKSRAARVDVAASSFDDSNGTATNYMIDLPGGANGMITNNWFVQGRNKENYSAFIAVAAEGKQHPSDQLVIAGNDARFATGVSRSSAFVADWSGEVQQVNGNALAGGLTRYQQR